MAVQGLDCGGFREASDQSSGAVFCGTTAGSKHAADRDVFDKCRVDLGAGDQIGECVGQQISRHCVFEEALATLGEGRAEGAGDDDIVGRLAEE